MIPVLEPANQQEAYQMTRYGFELSEIKGLPVMLRITTRLAHSRSGVERAPSLQQNDLRLPGDLTQFILLPSLARKRYRMLLESQQGLMEETDRSGFNWIEEGEDRSLGIVACGIAYN